MGSVHLSDEGGARANWDLTKPQPADLGVHQEEMEPGAKMTHANTGFLILLRTEFFSTTKLFSKVP